MLSPRSAYAQGGVPLWTNRYDGPANANDQPRAIAVDSSGNVFVTGYSGGIGTGPDYATIKYSSAGVPLWTNRYDGLANGEDVAYAIALDTSGNVFVTGREGAANHYSDYATIAYSNSGVPLWTNRYDGPGNTWDGASAIAVDSGGNVFVIGNSASNASFPWNGDYATIKYSNSGVPLWTNRYDGPGNGEDGAAAIAVDGGDNVFVTGNSYNANNSFDGSDYATVAYSSAGDLLWENRYHGPAGNSSDNARTIAVDTNGNVFVTGTSTGSASSSDYATIKYSNAGVPLWTNRYNGTGNLAEYASGIAVDSSGNVFVTGTSVGTGNNLDYATIKYSNAGVQLWTRRYNGPGNRDDWANAIAVDSSGNVFVTGRAYTINSNDDYATVSYSNSGVPLWTNRYNGLGNDQDEATATAVDRNGSVFVTGYSWNGTNQEWVTIKYSSSVPPPRLDFQTLNNGLVLSWTNAGFNLQTAPAVSGAFTNLPGATSPYTNVTTSAQQFFRLKQE